jgi:outer membrane murein-binding lipoprotein Lpp
LQQIISAATTGDVQAVTDLVAALNALFASLSTDVAALETQTAGLADDVADLADDITAAAEDQSPVLSTDPRIDALALEVGTLPPVASLPVSDPLLLQPTPSASELLSLLTELDKRVAALEQGAP